MLTTPPLVQRASSRPATEPLVSWSHLREWVLKLNFDKLVSSVSVVGVGMVVFDHMIDVMVATTASPFEVCHR